MDKELKINSKVKVEGYDIAWIGWVTNSSYLISKIRSILDEHGKTSKSWLFKNLEVEWVLKSNFETMGYSD